MSITGFYCRDDWETPIESLPKRYSWRPGGTLDEHDTGAIYEDPNGALVFYKDIDYLLDYE